VSPPASPEQTVREKLPEGFQRSEFLLEHGAIDLIVDRREMRDRVAGLLAMLTHQSLKEAESTESPREEAASDSPGEGSREEG